MEKSECRLLNIMARDLKIPNSECVKILNMENTFKEVFKTKISEWKFEGNKTKYIEKMRAVNEFLKNNGMTDTVFRNPENYETSFEDFHYFFDDKTITEYMLEEEKRSLTALTQDSEPETVFFGEFYQSDSSKKEPIEWVVLKREENKILILSKDCLECGAYYKNSEYMNEWPESDARKWLNNQFYNDAFNENEKKRILIDNENFDKIFLLSENLLKQFISNNNFNPKAKPTVYALNKGARTDISGFGWWWLSWTKSNAALSFVPCVSCSGSKGLRIEANREGICLRPAMWIQI